MQFSKIAITSLALVATLLVSAAAFATTGTESVLATFPAGQKPSVLIQASDGDFYGTVATGGANSFGYVFRLTPSGTLSTLYSFTNNSEGGTPTDSLIEGNDGNLYGTTTTGGSGAGAIFILTLAGTMTPIHNFIAATDGSNAGALIENSAGDLFGAATLGGASSLGTVYELSHLGAFTIVHTFTGTGDDGARPNSELLQGSDGFIYGATARGGANSYSGSLFRFDPTAPGSLTTIASLAPTNLADPYENPAYGMTEGQDGNLYGATSYGGTDFGTIYRVVPGATPAVTLNLYQFQSGSDGGLVASGLFLGGDGNFYGTTNAYGPGHSGGTGLPDGTIFQYIPSGAGTINVLYGFNMPDGNVTGAPVQAADSNFYGPAYSQMYQLTTLPVVPAPVTLAASSPTINLGASFTLNWNVTNAFSQTTENCYAHDGWTGPQALSGSQLITPASAGTIAYSLTCGGIESAFTTVTVVNTTPQTATPVITPASGTYNAPLEYQITDATPGAVIYYTTDGTTPTTASPIWDNTPKILSSTTTVEAIAAASSFTVSGVATADLTIQFNFDRNCYVSYAKGFSSTTTKLVLNHGASISTPLLQMTHGLLHEDTSAFTEPRVPLTLLATDFRFRFFDATPLSADGLTFTLQANSPNALGAGGGDLGYKGIPNSLAIKFDLHNNAGEGSDSVGLYYDGATPTIPSVSLAPSGINLHSGHILEAYITYDTQHVILNLTDVVTLKTFTHTFTVSSNPFGATTAYAGFTAASGTNTSKAQIISWTLESAGVCGAN